MSDCREFESLIDRAHAGEIDAAGSERLLAHLDTCAECSALFGLVGRLAAEAEVPEPSEHELARLRAAVLAEIAAATPGGARAARRAAPRLAVHPGWAAAAALVLVAGGAFAGGFAVTRGPLAARLGEEPLAARVRLAANRQSGLAASERSAYRYADVRIEPAPGNRVRLDFEVARHLDLELPLDEPLVADVLAQALAGAAGVGDRLRAVELAAGSPDPRLRGALIDAMRRDGNLGVRLAAQQTLASRPGDEATAAAMLELLGDDESMQMRLGAIDYLRREGVGLDRMLAAIRRGESPESRILLARGGGFLQDDDHQPSRGATR